jgi:hypothetical protein
MVRTMTWGLTALVVLATACTKQNEAHTVADSAGAVVRPTATDADKPQAGGDLPAGYVAMVDQPNAQISNAKYTESDGRWEVRTGPAHIIYAPKDSASGVYAVSTTIQQLEKPAHPEAYGIIFGGRHLDDRAAQRYGYFLVRGTGEYLLNVREGDKKPTKIIDWTASPNVPKEDASGKATYALKVHFAPDTVHFFVNGKLVAAAPKQGIPSDGIAGLRINHNLHLAVEPVTIGK